MGMAASQARLLSLTARIHDVEYQAQSIQNAKMQLATQSDQVYNEYLDALDATTLTIKTLNSDGSTAKISANFNNLFSSDHVNFAGKNSYALRNERGLLVVENDVYDAYNEFKNDDAYAFATYMLGNSYNASNIADDVETGNYSKNVQLIEEQVYQSALISEDKDKKLTEDSTLVQLHKSLEELVEDGDIYSGKLKDENDRKNYESLLNEYRDQLYTKFGEEISTVVPKIAGHEELTNPLMSKEDFNFDKMNYYISIFNQIKMCGGCVPIKDYNGSFGDAANNGDWLKAMIESGKFTIETVSKDKSGKYLMNGTSPSSDTYLSYTETSSIDNTVLKKAEAKYEHDLKEIDKKDKQYDLSLSKLDTERQALTTQYDSVKKVIQDNIDRTFGIFS